MKHRPDRRFCLPALALLAAAAAALAGSGPLAAQSGDARPPNVLLIFSDDQGTLDLNCYGSKDLYTPHLDGLARRGIRFSQFYAAAPVCSPSRAALLTGRYPQRAGVAGNVGLEAVGLPDEQVTIAEMLKSAGYATALVGKWHLGHVKGDGPLDQGFDSFFGHKRGCIDNYSHFFYWSGPNVHDLWRDREEYWEDGAYFSDMMVREAGRFMTANKDQPFFLYLPFNIPHYPLQGKAHFRKRYQKLPEPRRSYAAMVSTLDEQVGKVLNKLDDLGLRENTLVIFMSDHGHSTEERAMFGGGNAGPYRGAKFSLLEGGIRVPAIVSMPGRIPRNQVRDQLGTACDWLPTIAEITGAKLPARRIDGKSLAPILRSATARTAHPVFHWQLGDQWAVRQGDWKLVVNGRDTEHRSRLEGADRIFLSNMAVEATERQNIAAENAGVVDRLTRLHEEWAVEVQRQ